MSQSCPVCARDLLPFSAYLERCPSCGLAHTLQVASSGYDQDYRLKSDTARRQRTRYFRQLLRQFSGQLSRPGRALDVGCADVLLLDLLESQGWLAQGIEPFVALGDADPRISNIPLEKWSASAQFDLVTMLHTLEHVVNPKAVLQHIRSLLYPGGYLLINSSTKLWWSLGTLIWRCMAVVKSA